MSVRLDLYFSGTCTYVKEMAWIVGAQDLISDWSQGMRVKVYVHMCGVQEGAGKGRVRVTIIMTFWFI